MPKYDIQIKVYNNDSKEDIIAMTRRELTNHLYYIRNFDPAEARSISNKYAIKAFSGKDYNAVLRLTKEYVNVK